MAFYTYHLKCQCTGFGMKRNQSVLLIGRKAAEEAAKRINFRSQLRFFIAVSTTLESLINGGFFDSGKNCVNQVKQYQFIQNQVKSVLIS